MTLSVDRNRKHVDKTNQLSILNYLSTFWWKHKETTSDDSVRLAASIAEYQELLKQQWAAMTNPSQSNSTKQRDRDMELWLNTIGADGTPLEPETHADTVLRAMLYGKQPFSDSWKVLD